MEQLSDIFMAVSVAANCLMHGSQLPAHLPNLRDRVVYHAHKRGASSAKLDKQPTSPEEGDGETTQPEDVHDSSTGIEADELTLDVLLVGLLFDHFAFYFHFFSLISRTNIYLHMPPR